MDTLKIIVAPEYQPTVLAAAPRLFSDACGEYVETLAETPSDPAARPCTTKTYRVIVRITMHHVAFALVEDREDRATRLLLLPEPKQTYTEQERTQLSLAAGGLIFALGTSRVPEIFSDAVSDLWMNGISLRARDNLSIHRLGELMILDAILSMPGAAARMVWEVRERLKASDPSLALMFPASLPESEGVAEDREQRKQQDKDVLAMRAWALKDPYVRQTIRQKLLGEIEARKEADRAARAGKEAAEKDASS